MKTESLPGTFLERARGGRRRSVGVYLTFFLVASCLALFIPSQGFSDVVPGDVIDQTNWEKAQGLLPEPTLRYVKEGKLTIEVGELEYDVARQLPDYVLEAMKTNSGKYDLDEDDWIIEKETGKRTEKILGHPFPTIDPNDPKAATKIMYNTKYWGYVQGNFRMSFAQAFLSPTDFLRGVKALGVNMYMDGNPHAMAIPNPDRVEKYQIFRATSPYDISGTAVLTWRYRDPTVEDNTFAYVPAIRRVRRMTPANRSDGMMGSDMASDDAGMYDGKVTAMEWKFLRKEELLVPFVGKGTELIVQNEGGEWETTENVKEVVFGYQKEGWQGVPWAPLNVIWLKRPAYVVEVHPKDPYYNYGTQYIWVDAENWAPLHKIINDRADKFWKLSFHAELNYESRDKKVKISTAGNQVVVDERNKRSTISFPATSKDIWTFYANVNRDTFSLAGFQKFCK
jgi:Protein of unknown function (DUF1329)